MTFEQLTEMPFLNHRAGWRRFSGRDQVEGPELVVVAPATPVAQGIKVLEDLVLCWCVCHQLPPRFRDAYTRSGSDRQVVAISLRRDSSQR